MPDRPRVIVALTDPAEASAVTGWLASEGFEPVRRSSPQSAVEEMHARAYDLLIVDARLAWSAPLRPEGRMRRPLAPAILIGDGAPPRGHAVTGQPMYVERPVGRTLLGCYVSMAMLEGGPVRCSTRKTINPFEALVNGVPSHIVDLSAEGVRLRMVREGRSMLPPNFTVRVPLIGVAVKVRRVWTRSSPSEAPLLWYGAALAENRASAVQGWRSLVDTIPGATKLSSC